MGKNFYFYPQVFSEECNYTVKEKKISKCISNDLEISSNDYDQFDEKSDKSDKSLLIKNRLKLNIMIVSFFGEGNL